MAGRIDVTKRKTPPVVLPKPPPTTMTRTSLNTPDTQLPAAIGGSPPLTLLPQPTDKEEKRDPPALPPDIDLSTI